MTLRPRICATSNQTNNEKKTETGQKSRTHICVSPKRLSLKDSPRPVPCTTNPGSPQLVYPVRSAGATAPTILSSRPSATLEAITRSDSADFESAGRYMMRLVTSCITRRRPQTPAGATCREPSTECMLTTSQPHVDLGLAQPIAERVHLAQGSTSAILLS